MSEHGHEATESAPPKKKKRSPRHVHMGPHAKAYRSGLAFCPICDAERISKSDKTAEAAGTFRKRS